MATKNRSAPRRASRPREARRKGRAKKPVIHLLPDILIAGGILEPAFVPNGYDGSSPLDNFLNTNGTNPTINDKLGQGFKSSVAGYSDIGNLITAGELVVGGLIAKWIGKKTGLNHVGSKKVKIL